MEHLHFYPKSEKTTSLKPRVIFSGLLNGKDNWSNGVHRHNFCEIMYISTGEGAITVDNREYPVSTGDIIVYNTGIFHEERCTGDELKILFFAIDNLCIAGMRDGCIVPDDACPVFKSGSYDDVFKTFLSVMVTELSEKEAHYKSISTSIATLFCYYILRLYEVKPEQSPYMNICDKAKKYLDENFHKEISLVSLAGAFHISKYYFVRIFKEHIGLSPMKYLLFVRIEAAKDLLISTDMPIAKIGESVGYDNVTAFNRVFKSSENISPSEYRANAKSIIIIHD
ncbi:MAG: AraC family transcriptional regulator [Lachnospiraceae bacterium]|nr:AraC family transcriptional regulator [Lachnospiraceae bacterium]